MRVCLNVSSIVNEQREFREKSFENKQQREKEETTLPNQVKRDCFYNPLVNIQQTCVYGERRKDNLRYILENLFLFWENNIKLLKIHSKRSQKIIIHFTISFFRQ